MSESTPPRGKGHDRTQVIEEADLVELEVDDDSVGAPSSRPIPDEKPVFSATDDAWFVEPSAPRRRADNTLDAFLVDLAKSPAQANEPPAPARPLPPPSRPLATPKPPAPTAAAPVAVKAPAFAAPAPTPRPAIVSKPPEPQPAPSAQRPVFVMPTQAPVPVPAPEPPKPSSEDVRLDREVEALAPTLPTRAALVQAFRARVAVDVHGDVAGGAALCARAKTLAPDTRCVAMTARWISHAQHDVDATIAAARAEIPLAGDAAERLALLWQIATLEATPLEATLRQILELDPQDMGAWLALASSAMQRQSWAVACEAWEALAGRTEDAVARGAFHATAGGIRDEILSDRDGARVLLERALEADPANAGAHAGLQSIFLHKRSKNDLARAVALEAQRVGDLDPALAYHEHAGDLMWECMADPNLAARAYEHAAQLASADVVQLGKLASLYELEGRYAQLASVYERLLERLQDPLRRGAVLHRLGTLYETRLDKPDEAIRCYRAALDAVPTLAPAAQALAQVYMAQRRWNDAASVLLIEVDRLGDPVVRAARYVAIAELLEPQVGASAQVVTLLERALALDPAQTTALDALDRIYRTSGRWDNIIALHEAQLAQTSHPLRTRALRLALATLYLDHAGAPDKAAEQLRAALVGAPDRFFVLVVLARALAEAGKWAEHVSILEQEAKLVGDGVELVSTLYRIATVVESRLGDPGRALASYRRVLESQPRHELAIHAMLRIYRGQARWEDVLACERKLLELTDRPEEGAAILHRIALISEDQLARYDDAIDAHEAALKKLPGYRPSRVALERLLRASDRYDRLASLLEDQATGVPPADRARLLCQAALVRELHCEGQSEAATKLYEAALAAESALPTALWGLYRIYVAASAWKGATATLGLLVRQARHDTTRARLLVQLARIHELRLADNDRAIALLDASMTAERTPATVYERLRLALAHKADAARWLDEAAKATTDARMAGALLRLRAMQLEHDGVSAGTAYVNALAAASSPTVLEGLVRATKGATLGEALVHRARALKDPPARALLFTVAGALLEQGPEADAAYREALAAQPDFMPAIAGRREIAEAAGDWVAAARLCAEQAAVAMHPINKVELYEQAASFCERLGDDSAAIDRYHDALSVDPSRRSSLDRALALIEASGDWGRAASLIADHVAGIADEETRADLLARRGQILSERLGDADAAITDIERALVLRPGNPDLLNQLAALHEAVGRWADAARAYDLLAHSSDPGRKLDALIAQARIWTTEIPDYTRARRLLESARELEPSDRRVLADLADVAMRAGDQAGAAALLEDLGRRGSASERVASLLAAAELHRRLGTATSDIVAPGIELAFEDPSVIGKLEDHYRSLDNIAGYVATAEAAIVRRSASAPETMPLQASLGRLMARDRSMSDRAAPYLRAALAAAPEDGQLRVALGGALASTNPKAALAELRRAIELDPTDPLAYLRIAALCSQQNLELAASLASSAASLLGDEVQKSNVELLAIESPVAGALPADDALSLVVGATQVAELRRAIAILDPYIHVIFPDAQRQLGGTASIPSSYEVVSAISRLVSALGAPSIAIQQWRDRGEPTMLASDPRAFVISPKYLVDSEKPRIRFEAGAAIARLAGGALAVVPADDARALLLAIASPDAHDDHDYRRRVSQALPRRSRKELERLIADSDPIDANAIATWEREETIRAMRTGVIACCDFRAVARSICPDAVAAPTGAERRRRIRANARMVDALRFSVGDACWSVCKRLYGRA